MFFFLFLLFNQTIIICYANFPSFIFYTLYIQVYLYESTTFGYCAIWND